MRNLERCGGAHRHLAVWLARIVRVAGVACWFGWVARLEPSPVGYRWVSREENFKMAGDLGKPPETASGIAARRLATDTGITAAQATELVNFLGPHNWPSLLREARMLKKL